MVKGEKEYCIYVASPAVAREGFTRSRRWIWRTRALQSEQSLWNAEKRGEEFPFLVLFLSNFPHWSANQVIHQQVRLVLYILSKPPPTSLQLKTTLPSLFSSLREILELKHNSVSLHSCCHTCRVQHFFHACHNTLLPFISGRTHFFLCVRYVNLTDLDRILWTVTRN